jgi:NACHT domain
MGDPFPLATSISGLVSIADTVFIRTYRYVKLVKKAEKDIAELATGIRSLSGLLHGLSLVLSELEEERSETNFRLHHINSCRATLTKIQTRLDNYDPDTVAESKSDKLARSLKWPFSAPETKELIADVGRHMSTINVALSADSLSAILQVLSKQDALAAEVQDIKKELRSRWAMETHIALGKERLEILNFFGKIDPTSYQKSNLDLRHPLTGLWVSDGEIFQTWLHTRNAKLWMSGIPGAGKTILAASLIEETMKLSSPKRAVAYFYCDYREPEKQNPTRVLGSLAAQLARQNEDAFSFLQKLYKTCVPEHNPPSTPELPTLIATVYQMTTVFDDVSVIVDGLDECGDQTTTAVESLLKLSCDEESNIRLLILSRDVTDISGPLTGSFNHLEVSAQSEDLKLYVAAEIDKRLKKHGRGQLRIRNPDLKEDIKRRLVEQAGGMSVNSFS